MKNAQSKYFAAQYKCTYLGKFSVINGLQASIRCYCGNGYDKYGAAGEADCDKTCSGNVNEICGGFWRNSVYKCKVCLHTIKIYAESIPSLMFML